MHHLTYMLYQILLPIRSMNITTNLRETKWKSMRLQQNQEKISSSDGSSAIPVESPTQLDAMDKRILYPPICIYLGFWAWEMLEIKQLHAHLISNTKY